ncbi:MAG: dUTP pyrophosphatase [Candidatus Midichloriaceae bacterium]|jgi:dUTP pyrophosphatase
MKNIEIKIQKLDHLKELSLPKHATLHSAGMDLLSAEEKDVVIKPMERKLIATGIAISLPDGFEAQIRPRSGLSIKHGITVINAPGTIDSDYTGEIKIPIINLSQESFVIERGMRIAQMIINHYYRASWDVVEILPQNDTRGDGGFGSTGTGV